MVKSIHQEEVQKLIREIDHVQFSYNWTVEQHHSFTRAVRELRQILYPDDLEESWNELENELLGDE